MCLDELYANYLIGEHIVTYTVVVAELFYVKIYTQLPVY